MFNGENLSNVNDRYVSHGSGTFNVNPVGGLSGFYVGEKNLYSILSSNRSECEFTSPVKSALMDCFDSVSWKTDDVTKYRNLKKILGLPLTETITLSHSSLTIEAGDSVTLVASVYPDAVDASTLEWKSSDENIATVNDGVVTAISNGNVVICATKDGIKGECSVTVAASTVEYIITNDLKNCQNSNPATTANKGTAYRATITPNAGYKLGTIIYTMSGSEYVAVDGVISIASVTGNVVISGSATELQEFQIRFDGDNYTSSNPATTATEDASYSCTIIANVGYKLTSLKYSMSGQEFVSADGKISIEKVTGDIVITVETTALARYGVTLNLEHCTIDNTTVAVYEGSPYSATIVRDAGYVIDSIEATMGGEPVSVTENTIDISSVTGVIVITAVAKELQGFLITNRLENCTNTNTAATVEPNASYYAEIVPGEYSVISCATCRMGDSDVEFGDGYTLSIPQVTADIEICATAISTDLVDVITADYNAGQMRNVWTHDINFHNGDYVHCVLELSGCRSGVDEHVFGCG